ncbi:DUF4136 domain-containing protein [Lysobacter sp. LF1]|uniref:DUF4136 domain-containing protein n=1 Tax=Lysobacter stagni TaxID=3045172 RepID=A0ABT6XBM6_9GAMM|nr:DUF4136 domain-containing protein [Lysobacter sp. LF1]MDI9237318.1 DUF4136 domain-containing protein [Lysobacter sp. LF1]
MKGILLLALLFPVMATAAPKVTVDRDPAADFSAYKTYYWALKPQGGSPLVDERIVDNIDAQLKAKGWTLAEQGDVAVAAHVSTSQKQSLDTFYTGTPLGGWGWRGGWGVGGMGMGTATTSVHNYEVGTLIVDMFDSKQQKAIWRGTATETVSSSPAKVDKAVDQAVTKMFAKFPQ